MIQDFYVSRILRFTSHYSIFNQLPPHQGQRVLNIASVQNLCKPETKNFSNFFRPIRTPPYQATPRLETRQNLNIPRFFRFANRISKNFAVFIPPPQTGNSAQQEFAAKTTSAVAVAKATPPVAALCCRALIGGQGHSCCRAASVVAA